MSDKEVIETLKNTIAENNKTIEKLEEKVKFLWEIIEDVEATEIASFYADERDIDL